MNEDRRSFLNTSLLASGLALIHCFHPFWGNGRVQEVKYPGGIKHLKLLARDLPGQAFFYEKKLGLPVNWVEDIGLEVKAGKTTLLFYEDKKYPSPMYHFAFNIPENKWQKAMDWLKAKGIQILPDTYHQRDYFYSRRWDAHMVYFFDPSGNLVEFIARHTLANGEDGSFSKNDILYASEIGLVVDDVAITVDQLSQSMGLSPYSPPAANFAAIGDAQQLLIIVEKGRTWRATDVAAAVFPTGATLSGTEDKTIDFKGLPYQLSFSV